MKRLILPLLLVSVLGACTRSGRPVIGQALEQTGKEYVDPYYFRKTPQAWKVIWFIGPGHCPFIRPTSALLGIEKIVLKDPDTNEHFVMRSPLSFVWLYPIERLAGTDSNRGTAPVRGGAGKSNGNGTLGGQAPRMATPSAMSGAGAKPYPATMPGGIPAAQPPQPTAPEGTIKGVPDGAELILSPEFTPPAAPQTRGMAPGAGAAQPAGPGTRPRIPPPTGGIR
jgi:hypothetical protein